MREFVRGLVNRLRSKKNNEPEAISILRPSSFVLIQDGKEIRLNVGETIRLNHGSCDNERKKITSFVVCPEFTYLELKIVHGSPDNNYGYQESHWGYMSIHGRIDEKKWTTSFTENAFEARDGKKYIKGSNMYFNDEKTEFHGHDWTLQYKPVDSKS